MLGPFCALIKYLRKQPVSATYILGGPGCRTGLSGAGSGGALPQVLVVVGYGAIRDVRILWLDVDVVKEVYLCKINMLTAVLDIQTLSGICTMIYHRHACMKRR